MLLAEIAFPAAPRKTIPPAGVVVTVQLKVSVASTLAPSRTVIETANGLDPAAPAAIVPDTSPVAPSIDKPDGRPVAAKVSGSPSGSVAPAGRFTASPSTLDRSPTSWLKVGSVLTTTTAADVMGAELFEPSEARTVTAI